VIAYWLMKSEPDVFGVDDLRARPKQREPWDGVRNYQARNMLRDEMKVGDLAFFYHSNCKEPGIAGVMKIVRAGYPDDTAMNPESPYYDPKHTAEQPRWYRVDVQFERKLKRVITLDELKQHPELETMALLRKGNRLSIMPVTPRQWDFILKLEDRRQRDSVDGC
jgi:predicted RNA-binding protein with PUA-like domain